MTRAVLYRYDARPYGGGAVVVELREYPVERETPCGVWINVAAFGRSLKWVSLSGKKRFAYPTVTEAATSFRRRKQMQIAILREQLARAEAASLAALPERVGTLVRAHVPESLEDMARSFGA